MHQTAQQVGRIYKVPQALLVNDDLAFTKYSVLLHYYNLQLHIIAASTPSTRTLYIVSVINLRDCKLQIIYALTFYFSSAQSFTASGCKLNLLAYDRKVFQISVVKCRLFMQTLEVHFLYQNFDAIIWIHSSNLFALIYQFVCYGLLQRGVVIAVLIDKSF